MKQQRIDDAKPDYAAWETSLDEAAKKFLAIPAKEPIRIIGHLDADGICASAILINALMILNRKYALTILPTVIEEAITLLAREQEKYFVFVDLGSGNITTIGELLRNKTVFILDHHLPEPAANPPNITHVNPHYCNIDGSQEVSGAGVTFIFTQKITHEKNTEMARIAIVGAIGDAPAFQEFQKLNNTILQLAIKNNLIEVKRGLRFFGVQTKPIHKILQYSADIIIPEVSGSESGAIAFLEQLGINPRKGKYWKKIADLTEEEKKKLIAGIIAKREDQEKPEDIFANAYLFVGEEEDSPYRDAKEFATLLNSCGRLGKASIGIGACLNDTRMKELAVQNLAKYRKEIVNAMHWYKDQKNTNRIIKGKNYIIINAEEDILPTMIGTFGSILSKSNTFEENTFILTLARNIDTTTKVSLRVSGQNPTINLKDIITRMIARIAQGTAGGHLHAAGAVINTEDEEKFIDAAMDILGKA